MKKYILLLSAVTALAALASCNKTEPGEDFGNKNITINASFSATKAWAGADGLAWIPGDEIKVVCDGEAYDFMTPDHGATARFIPNESELTQNMVGINPLTAYFGCTQFGAFTIAQNQTILGENSQTKIPLYAYTATAPEKAEVSMAFTPAASVVDITITPAEVTLNKVELVPVEETGVVGCVAGAGSVNPVTGKVTFNGNLKTVSATLDGGSSLKNGLNFRFPVGWFSVTGGMKLVLTYDDNKTYEELLWAGETFQSYAGSGDAKAYKFIPVTVELVLGARDYYVAANGSASSKGIRESDPTTLDYALSTAEAGSVLHLAAGTYNPARNLQGDVLGDAAHKTFEIASGISIIGAGAETTILDAAGAYHAVCVTAPAEEKVILKNLTIKGGNNSEALDDTDDSGFVLSTVNKEKYLDSYGTGLYAIGSDIEMENVKITGNNGRSGVGAYVYDSKVSLKNVEVSGNASKGNGAGFWSSASALTAVDCSFSGNSSTEKIVAGGLYIYAASEKTSTATVTNCSFVGNDLTAGPGSDSGLYVRGYDSSSKVTATFTNCIIKENLGNMGAGFGTTYCTAVFDGCQILNNTSSGNGANLVYPGANVTIKDCIFRGNTATLAAGIYEYTDKDAMPELTVLNSEFSGNTTTGRGGAIYARAANACGVKLYVANTTIFGNTCGSTGSAIALYGSASFKVNADIYSCTITGNTCTRSSDYPGGAIGLETAGLTADIYNSVVSGNTWAANAAAADLYVKSVSGTSATCHKSVIGTAVYDADGAVVGSAPAFAPATMLSKKVQEGNTTVFQLVGDNNPAKTYGYDVAGLKGLGSTIDGSILEKDQWGNARTGSVMGAYVQ